MNTEQNILHRIVDTDIFTRCGSVISLEESTKMPSTEISDRFEMPRSNLMWQATGFTHCRWCRLSSQDKSTMSYLLRGTSTQHPDCGADSRIRSSYYTKDRETDLQFLNCHYANFIWFWGHSEDNTAHENLSVEFISHGGLGSPNLPNRNKK